MTLSQYLNNETQSWYFKTLRFSNKIKQFLLKKGKENQLTIRHTKSLVLFLTFFLKVFTAYTSLQFLIYIFF